MSRRELQEGSIIRILREVNGGIEPQPEKIVALEAFHQEIKHRDLKLDEMDEDTRLGVLGVKEQIMKDLTPEEIKAYEEYHDRQKPHEL